jgi:Xaa-Pro dipeptidase
METYKKRMGRLLYAGNGNIDSILLFNEKNKSSNFLYMTGFTSGLFEDTPLLLQKKGMVLFSNSLEYETAIEQSRGNPDIEVKNMKSKEEILRYTKGKVIGFDGDSISINTFKRLRKLIKPKEMRDVSESFGELRLVKDENEISLIKKANSIVKRTFSEVEKYFVVGMTEKDLAAKFNNLMMRYGADETSFETIVCFGKNSALPHHFPDNTRLRKNEFILIDAGAKYKNYCSDVTRTFIFKPDIESARYKRMSEMLEVVKEAQKIALSKARDGAFSDSIHKAAEDYINSYGNGRYNGKFIHSLGHSIGIDVHDSSAMGLSNRIHKKIGENMVFSDEPGIYINGFGGVRIEDDMLITKNGAVFL